ncbi:MAG: helix-turn-helix transcriptional regulator [Clostridia bacterium]|nr:helix-turn-helix transcriptional regulator [Clostridia bacterium]
MNIGEKIKTLRTQRQMTQAELAGESVSRNMVSLIENGRATPSIQTLESIAQKLRVTTAYLTADEREQTILSKSEMLADVRLAFSGKNYRICADLCRTLYGRGLEPDHEIDLAMAESLMENAKEAFGEDRVRLCCALLDEAVFYAERTMYYTDHIVSAAWLFFEYLSLLSPTLASENIPSDFQPSAAAERDVFCRYMGAMIAGEETLSHRSEDPAFAPLLAEHLRARRLMREGDYEQASAGLSEILRSPDLLPGVVMYHVFGDMEECCRRSGNRKNETNYREAKLSVAQKLLS